MRNSNPNRRVCYLVAFRRKCLGAVFLVPRLTAALSKSTSFAGALWVFGLEQTLVLSSFDVEVAWLGKRIILLAGCGSLAPVGGNGSWVPAFIWLLHGSFHAPGSHCLVHHPLRNLDSIPWPRTWRSRTVGSCRRRCTLDALSRLIFPLLPVRSHRRNSSQRQRPVVSMLGSMLE